MKWVFKLRTVSSNTGLHTCSYQPVFIIGAPRTGSTIIYQALTNAYRFAYIDNVACTWCHNLSLGLWLSNKKYGDKPHNNFKAEHGDTRKFGGHAPSECGQFWYRWLPKHRHFIDHNEVTSKMVKEIREEVFRASSYLKRPLLFKNLNAGQRLRLIHEVFPKAKFIFVRRDPRFVTRSILKARRKIGTQDGQWWSVMPPNVEELRMLPEGEMCAAQVYFLEQQIEKDLTLFPKENIQEVHYQNLDENLVNLLGEWCGVTARGKGEIPKFQHDDLRSLKPSELEELNSLVEKYPFKKELFLEGNIPKAL
ncbi:sulfotransferase family protein [Billgrantia gudaonensis]|nr:sulfotransferase [Halomonas gudaonensis]